MKNPEKKVKQKRYNLVLPQEVFDEIQAIADANGTTVLEVLRKFIKLGFIAAEIETDPDRELIIRNGEEEKKIVFY